MVNAIAYSDARDQLLGKGGRWNLQWKCGNVTCSYSDVVSSSVGGDCETAPQNKTRTFLLPVDCDCEPFVVLPLDFHDDFHGNYPHQS